jgi:hypothetical protein
MGRVGSGKDGGVNDEKAYSAATACQIAGINQSSLRTLIQRGEYPWAPEKNNSGRRQFRFGDIVILHIFVRARVFFRTEQLYRIMNSILEAISENQDVKFVVLNTPGLSIEINVAFSQRQVGDAIVTNTLLRKLRP